jgi:SAM-dependent methyltransferase
MTQTHQQSRGAIVRLTCPGCDGHDLRAFFEARQVPVHCNVLYDSQDAAESAPRGDISLVFCEDCGLIFNRWFDQSLTEYSESYENSLYFSPAFREYADWLVDHLIDAFDLHGKDLVEIGCGSADFLSELCERGNNRGFGFDPSAPPSRFPRVTIVREYYGPKHAGQHADAVFSRHVLEHVGDPSSLLAGIRAAVDAGTRMYTEVPNASFILKDMSLWDVIYEHAGYFTYESLRRLLTINGFEVTDAFTGFGSQFLGMESVAGATFEPPGFDLDELSSMVDDFGDAYQDRVAYWEQRLADWDGKGKRVALWGAGSKGVTFLNIVAGANDISVVVDINPRKRGKHVPGTGQGVVGPEDLGSLGLDRVLVMNPLYSNEIASQLDLLGIQADIDVV